MTVSSRRAVTLGTLLAAGTALLLLHLAYRSPGGLSFLPSAQSPGVAPDDLAASDVDVKRRVARMRKVCAAQNTFTREYGRANLRLSRGYEGGSV